MFRVFHTLPCSFIIVMVLSGLARAHTESELASVVPPHGGLLASVGDHHVELVLRLDRVQVFLTDRFNKPIAVQTAAGVANLRVKGQKPQQVRLQVVEDHLEGSAVILGDVPVTVTLVLNIEGKEHMVPYVWPAGGPKRKPAGQEQQ